MFWTIWSRAECPPVLFFFNDTATTEIYTLSLHDALPISSAVDCWLRRIAWTAASGSIRRTMSVVCASSSGLRHWRSEEHTSELQSPDHLVCRLLLEKKNHRRRLPRDVSPRAGRRARRPGP